MKALTKEWIEKAKRKPPKHKVTKDTKGKWKGTRKILVSFVSS